MNIEGFRVSSIITRDTWIYVTCGNNSVDFYHNIFKVILIVIFGFARTVRFDRLPESIQRLPAMVYGMMSYVSQPDSFGLGFKDNCSDRSRHYPYLEFATII